MANLRNYDDSSQESADGGAPSESSLRAESISTTDRRSFLVRSIAGVTGIGLTVAACDSTPTERAEHATPSPATSADSQAIDTHAHVYPASILDRLESIGIDPRTTKIARDIRASDSDADMAARLKMMDDAGVVTQIISATPQVPVIDDPRAAATVARELNAIYHSLVQKYPGRLKAYGTAVLPHIKESIAETAYCLDELGFVGMAVNTFLQNGRSLADPAFEPFYAELDRRRAILYIHPTGCGAYSPVINDHHLEWVNGAPVEDATAVLHILKADIPHRFPNITFHIAHLGGDLPFLARRLEDNFEDWRAFKHSPLETMRAMYFDAANFHEPSLRLAVETVGASQIMCGSDYPYFQDAKYTRAVSYVRDSSLDSGTKDAILSSNARRLYGI